jgi:hypothetical protein
MTMRRPADQVLAGHPGIWAARLCLGLTLYLEEMDVWAARAAEEAMDLFLGIAPRERILWAATSAQDLRYPVNDLLLANFRRNLAGGGGRIRHLLRVRLADDVDVPTVAFTYREVDPRLSRRAGVLQICLPAEADPALLVDLARKILDRFPVHVGVGGFLAQTHPRRNGAGFGALRGWCRRYLGVDVQVPDAMAWAVHDRIPGTNWLNVLGTRFADLARVGPLPCAGGMSVEARRHGTLLVAGATPTIADLNQLELPKAYLTAARMLSGLLVDNPPAFPSAFDPDSAAAATRAWFRRFVEPAPWSSA